MEVPEVAVPLPPPRYDHDCTVGLCTYLGHFEELDLYAHPVASAGLLDLIGRYGTGDDYRCWSLSPDGAVPPFSSLNYAREAWRRYLRSLQQAQLHSGPM